MPDTQRKRIVIDFGNKLPGAGGQRPRGKGGLSRVLLFLAVLVVGVVMLAIAGGYFWWQHYKTTPAYSLAVLVDAARRDDATTIDQIVNSEKVATNLSGEIAQKAAGRYGMALEATARQRVDALIPALMPRVKQSLREEIVKTVSDVSPNTARRPLFLVALAVPYAVKITTEKQTAKVSIPNRETQLTMERNGDRWQVVGIQDAALVQRLVDRLAEDLPAIAPPVQGVMPGRPPGSRGRRRRR